MSNHRFCCCGEGCVESDTSCIGTTYTGSLSLVGSSCFNNLFNLNSCETGPVVFDVELNDGAFTGWLCDAPESVLCSDPDTIVPGDIPPCYACTYANVFVSPTCGTETNPRDLTSGTIPYWLVCIQYIIYVGGECSPFIAGCLAAPPEGQVFTFYGLFYKSRIPNSCNITGVYTTVNCSTANADTTFLCTGGGVGSLCPDYFFTTSSTLSIA